MSAHSELDYAIIGGGIGGLTLGLALHQRGINVRIYEAAHHFGEIGAGVGFTPNAIQAMGICHPAVYSAFQATATKNKSEAKKNTWFDFYDACPRDQDPEASSKWVYDLTIEGEMNGVHRAHFLNKLIHAFPADRAEFGKRLERYEKDAEGVFTLYFRDGTTASAHAIIGCDGIKSHVRSSMFGNDHPCASPSYTGKYAYRALADMKDAVEVIGEERAMNGSFFLGDNGHVLTFPLENYTILNLVAFYTDKSDWTDHEHLTAHATREEMLKDFDHFSPDVKQLLSLAKPDLDKWGIFDLHENPPPTFAQGRVCLLGDAAHATSPHHGAGAGMCIEDAAVLSSLLADENVTSYEAVETAFALYSELRQPRGENLVNSSRALGEAEENQNKEIGRNFPVLHDYALERTERIHGVDVAAMCADAVATLNKRLGVAA